MKYYISDCHFFHYSMNNHMDNRGFSSGEEMNRYMIDQWNSKVRARDEVYVLGDFSVGGAAETNEVLRELHGRKFLITGNHDKFIRKPDFDASAFEWIQGYAEVHDGSHNVCLCHYPIICYNGQYRKSGNICMLYGHVHETDDYDFVRETVARCSDRRFTKGDEEFALPCKLINCFCMRSDYVPLSLVEWMELEHTNKNQKGDSYDNA